MVGSCEMSEPLSTQDDGKPRESCGLFGVYGDPNAASLIYRGLFALQHRGQEGAGIVVSDGQNIHSIKGMGLVSEVVAKQGIDQLKGQIGIGHVRYSTTGSSRIQNVQPLVAECADGLWVVAHNGNLTNADQLRKMYQESGSIFQTSTDSEVLMHLLADPMYRNRPQRLARALAELKGAYSFLIMTAQGIMAARDPNGFRPLVIGRKKEAWVFASETCALNQINAQYVRDVQPGELVTIDAEGLKSHTFSERSKALSQCVFELVYFARPDSQVFGYTAHDVRLQYGLRLAQEHPADADIVVSIPDSGNSAALGFSRGSGLPLDYGFIRNHYVGRTFIMPTINGRQESVDMKLAVLQEVVKGKRVVMVDDSIVRGTTARRRVRALRQAGAKEVHIRVACPPVSHPCFFGIDFPTKNELVAGNHNVEEIRQFLEADSLGYLSMEGLFSPFKDSGDFCAACFNGKYKVPPPGMEGDKNRLERFVQS